MRNNTQLQQPMQTLQPSNPLGKRHALKIYDQFAVNNTTIILADQILVPKLLQQFHEIFVTKNDLLNLLWLMLLLKQKFREIVQLCTCSNIFITTKIS